MANNIARKPGRPVIYPEVLKAELIRQVAENPDQTIRQIADRLRIGYKTATRIIRLEAKRENPLTTPGAEGSNHPEGDSFPNGSILPSATPGATASEGEAL